MVELDKRNVLRTGPSQFGVEEVTHAMVDAVRQRITAADGQLTVWAVLEEDTYETSNGDGFYLHVKGIALSSAAAHDLAAQAEKTDYVRWYVKAYRLGLKDGAPVFLDDWPLSEEFDISKFVLILSEISADGIASRLNVGRMWRENGPFVQLPHDWKQSSKRPFRP